MIQVGSEVRVSMPAEVVEIYRGITGLKWFVVEMRNGERKHVLVSSLNEVNLNKPENVDSADDGPEVSILRQPVQREKKYGIYMVMQQNGEIARSLSLNKTYLSKKDAENAIVEYLESNISFFDHNYRAQEIL